MMKWCVKFKMLFQFAYNDNRGGILLFVMVFGAISFTLVVLVMSGYSISEKQASDFRHNREQAFQIAEAGANYYRWHLAHNKEDYYDGTGASGTYEHEYADKDGNVIGRFSLQIIPPVNGSTIVEVRSTGWLDKQPGSRRTTKAMLGFPS